MCNFRHYCNFNLPNSFLRKEGLPSSHHMEGETEARRGNRSFAKSYDYRGSWDWVLAVTASSLVVHEPLVV